MKITYIYHSGFLLETSDHYNPIIFSKLAELGMKHVTAVLSKDIPNRIYPSGVGRGIRTIQQTDDRQLLP